MGCVMLPERIENGGQFRCPLVGAEPIAVPNGAIRQTMVARVTVASPRLNAAPLPPMHPRTMTRPVSGPRRRS